MENSNTVKKYLIYWGGYLYEGIIISLKYDEQQWCYVPINISMSEAMSYKFVLHWDAIEYKGEYKRSYHIDHYGYDDDIPGFPFSAADIKFCCDEDRLLMRRI